MKTLLILGFAFAAVTALAQSAVSFSTPQDEYGPSITADGRRIYFNAALPGGMGGLDIWYADRDDSAWSDPVNVGAPVNTKFSERSCVVSADGKTMLLTLCDQPEGYGDCDLYMSTMQSDGTWSKPANLGAAVNTSSWESFPSISRNGRTIYFASDRGGGVGGIDIYVTTKLPGSDWSDPVNVAGVNTVGNDVTPYISMDDSTMYFASDGFGEEKVDLDIYMSRRSPTGWLPAVPVHPVNSPSLELFPSMSGNQKTLYFCSTRHGKKKGGMDIFYMDLPEVFRPRHAFTVMSGKVRESENSLPIGATVMVTTDDIDSIVSETNPLSGEFSFIVPRGHVYRISASAKDCYQNLTEVNIDSNADERVSCNLSLEKLQIGKPHIAERIFQEGTDLFTREGQAELRKLNTLFKYDRTLRAALFVNNEDGANDSLLRQLRIERLKANLRRVNRDLTNIDWKPLPFQGESLEAKKNYIILVPILN